MLVCSEGPSNIRHPDYTFEYSINPAQCINLGNLVLRVSGGILFTYELVAEMHSLLERLDSLAHPICYHYGSTQIPFLL